MTQAPTAPPEPDLQGEQDAAQGDETPQADAEPVETPDEAPQDAEAAAIDEADL